MILKLALMDPQEFGLNGFTGDYRLAYYLQGWTEWNKTARLNDARRDTWWCHKRIFYKFEKKCDILTDRQTGRQKKPFVVFRIQALYFWLSFFTMYTSKNSYVCPAILASHSLWKFLECIISICYLIGCSWSLGPVHEIIEKHAGA